MNRELFNPIEPGDGIPDEVFQKYIDIRNKQYKLLPTLPEVTTEIKKRFFDAHEEVDKKRLYEVWGRIFNRVCYNQAFAAFVLDNGGAESDYFFPWVEIATKSSSEMLELSYNAGWNLNDEWIEDIPEDDSINCLVRNLPVLVYNREWQLKVADLVTTDRDRMKSGEISRVLDLSAGKMAWARCHGFKFKPRIQQIMACDEHLDVEAENLFGPFAEYSYGLLYRQCGIVDMLKRPECLGASLVILQGMAAYYSPDAFRELIVKPVYYTLADGGSFFFDLQLNHVSYEWCVKVLGWPEMALPNKVADAVDAVEAMRKALWLDGMKFDVEYALSSYNATPISVMVTLTKN